MGDIRFHVYHVDMTIASRRSSIPVPRCRCYASAYVSIRDVLHFSLMFPKETESSNVRHLNRSLDVESLWIIVGCFYHHVAHVGLAHCTAVTDDVGL
jgi:hypothetical protein